MPQSKPSAGKFVPILIVAAVLLPVSWFAGHRFLEETFNSIFLRSPPEKKFMEAWDADLKRLEKAKSLPAGFKDLKQIKLSTPSEKLKASFKKYPLELLNTKPDGHYVLEIFLDEIEDGGVVVQYDLVEKKSGNTIWELGRTFPHKISSAAR